MKTHNKFNFERNLIDFLEVLPLVADLYVPLHESLEQYGTYLNVKGRQIY